MAEPFRTTTFYRTLMKPTRFFIPLKTKNVAKMLTAWNCKTLNIRPNSSTKYTSNTSNSSKRTKTTTSKSRKRRTLNTTAWPKRQNKKRTGPTLWTKQSLRSRWKLTTWKKNVLVVKCMLRRRQETIWSRMTKHLWQSILRSKLCLIISRKL